jgi:hypothetical protein
MPVLAAFGGSMRRLCVVVLVAAALLSVAPASVAATKEITFSVEPVAVSSADGTTLTVRVTVSCPANYSVLEAFVYVVQGGQQSNFVGIPLTCRPSGQEYTLTVPAPEGQAWTEGDASLSGFVLLERKSTTLSASPAAPLQVVIP